MFIKLDIQSIYINYFNAVNKMNEKCDKIYIYVLKPKEKYNMKNKNRKKAILLSQQWFFKFQHYEKIIDIIQSLAFAKQNQSL